MKTTNKQTNRRTIKSKTKQCIIQIISISHTATKIKRQEIGYTATEAENTSEQGFHTSSTWLTIELMNSKTLCNSRPFILLPQIERSCGHIFNVSYVCQVIFNIGCNFTLYTCTRNSIHI